MQYWKQLRILLWKNFVLKRRSPWLSLSEIVVPLFALLIFTIFRSQIHIVKNPPEYRRPLALPSSGPTAFLRNVCPTSALGSLDETLLSYVLRHSPPALTKGNSSYQKDKHDISLSTKTLLTKIGLQNSAQRQQFISLTSKWAEIDVKTLSENSANYEEILLSLQYLACSPSSDINRKSSNPQVSALFRRLNGTWPKFLYAPINSDADIVIDKILDSLLPFVDLTKDILNWLDDVEALKKNLSAIHHDVYDDDTASFIAALEWTVEVLSPLKSIDVNFNIPKLIHGFLDETRLEEYFLHHAYEDNSTVLASTIFEVDEDGHFLPQTIYKIRQNASFTPATRRVIGNYYHPQPHNTSRLYYELGFTWIQDLVERALIEIRLEHSIQGPGIEIQEFPHPCYINDAFKFFVEHMLSIALLLTWIFTLSLLVRNVIYEKETRLREVMKIMGLSGRVLWHSWILSSCISATMIAIVITMMLILGNLLIETDWLIVFIVNELYALNTVFFGLFMTLFFNRANIASATAAILYIVCYIPYFYVSIVQTTGHQEPDWLKMICSLLAPSAVGLIFNEISFYEAIGHGLQWHNLNTPIHNDINFTVFYALIMMTASIVFFSICIWYFDNVFPGEYGIGKPWNFFIKCNYWCQKYDTTNSQPLDLTAEPQTTSVASEYHEKPPTTLPLTVCIQRLIKIYPNGRLAVNNLSLNLYEGQIMSFLGHNGAGKTTTMSILAGMIPMTSGHVSVYGYDLTNHMGVIHSMIAMCPQNNVLFETLSVQEHLEFYSSLRSLSDEEKRERCSSLLRDTGLDSKANCPVNTLSGGMKRKLSIAIAFIGQAKLVILDEPTAGIDPCSRREIWDLLIKYKKGRTILLSTHHMDEAEALGDRISIISSGCLLCDGSPQFLKSNLGEGYHLVLTKKPRLGQPSSTRMSTSKVTLLIQSFIRGAYLKSESLSEWNYVLPYFDLNLGSFPALFDELDKHPMFKESYGLSDGNLEEVFLKLTREAGEGKKLSRVAIQRVWSLDGKPPEEDEKRKPRRQRHRRNKSDGALTLSTKRQNSAHSRAACFHPISDDTGSLGTLHKQTGSMLYLQQFFACVIKRILLSLRNWKGFLSQIFLPVMFIAVAMVVAVVGSPQLTPEPPLILATTQYLQVSNRVGDIYTPIGAVDDIEENLNYLDTFALSSGIGAVCTRSDPFDSSQAYSQLCYDVVGPFEPLIHLGFGFGSTNDTAYNDTIPEDDIVPTCHCSSSGKLICDYSTYTVPPSFRTVTRDIIQDFTGASDIDFLYNTSNLHQLGRYGSISFGHMKYWLPESDFTDFYPENIAKAFFHTHGYHAMPTFVNALNNAILRANIPERLGNPSAYGIVAINHPMNGTTSLDHMSSDLGHVELKIACLVSIGMAFVPSLIALQMVAETKAKQLQLVSGLRPVIYWTSTLFSDLFIYLVPAASCIAIFLIFGIPAYTDAANMPSIVALFIMYGVGCIPVTYLLSRKFQDPSYAYIFTAIFNIFTGVITMFVIFLIEYLDSDTFEKIGDYLDGFFLIFPSYALARGLMKVAVSFLMNEFYEILDMEDRISPPMSFSNAGSCILALGLVGLFAFILTLLSEYPFFVRDRKRTLKLSLSDESTDEDVIHEMQRVRTICEQGKQKENVVVLQDITKAYTSIFGRVQHVAVKQISLAIPKGECFGMLGVNGAGKTSTFNVLTGGHSPSNGQAWISGYSIASEMHKVRGSIGYCPQFDALYEHMTAMEHLLLFARLRGIARRQCSVVAKAAIKQLALDLYANEKVRTYSGGNRRKLSTAIALMGDPSVILMDEPTAGMDPHAKRFLWNLVLKLIQEGKSIVLTSHSMEECEKLCNRVALMKNGQVKCIGSVQHLKSKYGDGYSLIVLLKSEPTEDDTEQVKRFVTSSIPMSSFRTKQHCRLEFELKGMPNIANIFRAMENVKGMLPIEDYSLCQNNLSNVFVNFVKSQNEAHNGFIYQDFQTTRL